MAYITISNQNITVSRIKRGSLSWSIPTTVNNEYSVYKRTVYSKDGKSWFAKDGNKHIPLIRRDNSFEVA